jgi:hypothetical protein
VQNIGHYGGCSKKSGAQEPPHPSRLAGIEEQSASQRKCCGSSSGARTSANNARTLFGTLFDSSVRVGPTDSHCFYYSTGFLALPYYIGGLLHSEYDVWFVYEVVFDN